jgi:hypothetical protein
VLINAGAAQTVAVRVRAVRGTGTLTRLMGTALSAPTGVTLGGQSYGTATRTGTLAGRSTVARVNKTGAGYVVTLPGASAAMLTIAPGARA